MMHRKHTEDRSGRRHATNWESIHGRHGLNRTDV